MLKQNEKLMEDNNKKSSESKAVAAQSNTNTNTGAGNAPTVVL